MAKKIDGPTVIMAAGNKPKRIEEFFGRINSGSSDVSIARMVSPVGWIEPGQQPEFDEYTVVLKGRLHVRTEAETVIVSAGEGIFTLKGEWVQYSTPGPEEAEYIAICLPAFSPETVHRNPTVE